MPQIVFAFADDWGRYASAYAEHESGSASINALLLTKNFDRVASEGALFLNALVPAPSCTPCRSSLLSGRYFWQTGLGASAFAAHARVTSIFGLLLASALPHHTDNRQVEMMMARS